MTGFSTLAGKVVQHLVIVLERVAGSGMIAKRGCGAGSSSRRMVITRLGLAGHDMRPDRGAGLELSSSNVHVTAPVQAIFDAPVPADDRGQSWRTTSPFRLAVGDA